MSIPTEYLSTTHFAGLTGLYVTNMELGQSGATGALRVYLPGDSAPHPVNKILEGISIYNFGSLFQNGIDTLNMNSNITAVTGTVGSNSVDLNVSILPVGIAYFPPDPTFWTDSPVNTSSPANVESALDKIAQFNHEQPGFAGGLTADFVHTISATGSTDYNTCVFGSTGTTAGINQYFTGPSSGIFTITHPGIYNINCTINMGTLPILGATEVLEFYLRIVRNSTAIYNSYKKRTNLNGNTTDNLYLNCSLNLSVGDAIFVQLMSDASSFSQSPYNIDVNRDLSTLSEGSQIVSYLSIIRA